MATHCVDIEMMAKNAFLDNHYELAVDLYSQAIDSNPSHPGLYADRALAHIKLSNFIDAVDDANRAILLDPSMPKAYLLKGTACLKLEEYEIAKTTFQEGAAALAPGNFKSMKFIKECAALIAEAVADANIATVLDPSMPEAYMQEGTACLKLEEYQTAKTAFQERAALAPGNFRFTEFIEECYALAAGIRKHIEEVAVVLKTEALTRK